MGTKLSEALGTKLVHRTMHERHETVASTVKLGAVVPFSAIDIQGMCAGPRWRDKALRRYAKTPALISPADQDE